MAKPNYQFAKRQRDLAKKKKREEKAARKRAASEPQADPEVRDPETSAGAPPEPAE